MEAVICPYGYFSIIPDLLYSISERGTICIDSVRSVYNKLPELTKNSIMG